MTTRRTRYVQQRDESLDALLCQAAEQYGYHAEVSLWGLESQEHADEIRRGLRRAARHLGVAVKALWHPCGGCEPGGPEQHYDLAFTIYPLAEAREFMAAKAEALGWPKRGGGRPVK